MDGYRRFPVRSFTPIVTHRICFHTTGVSAFESFSATMDEE